MHILHWTYYHEEKMIDITGLYSFYYFELQKDFSFHGERHDFWEMVYVDNGEVVVMADKRGLILKQGDIIFHKPMEFHTIAGNRKEPPNILVTTFKCNSKAMDFFKNKQFVSDKQQRKLLQNYLNEGLELFGSESGYPLTPSGVGKPGGYQQMVGCLKFLLIDLIRKDGQMPKPVRLQYSKDTSDNALVEGINLYLNNNVYGQISLEDVCKKFNMSKSHICHIYKEATGESIMKHYIDLKITCAKCLIREGELNFTQISEKLQFSSIHHFTRSFKCRTKKTPSAYEKSLKKDYTTDEL